MAKVRKILALTLAVCCLAVTVGSLSVCADATNIILNPGFETEGTSGTESSANWTDTYRTAATPENPAHSGDWYAKPSGSVVSTIVDVSPDTDYVLSFWTRGSLADSGKIDIRFYANNALYSNMDSKEFIWGEHLYQETFGIAHAAPEADEPDARLVWEKAEFEFTTPAKADSLYVRILNNASDPYFCLDDVSLALSGREPNLIKNGYMKCFKPGGVPAGFSGGITYNATDATYTTDTDGSTLITAPTGATYFTNLYPSRAGRYKLSFDYKNDGSAGYRPTVYMKIGGTLSGWVDGWKSVQNMEAKKVWNHYELYVTIPANPDGDGETGCAVSDFRISLNKYDASYAKNFRFWRDTTNVEYGRGAIDQAVYNTAECITTERYNPVASVQGGNLAAGAYTVLSKAHYIPQTENEEAYKLITALYRVYEDNTSALEKIQMVDGTATGGIVSNIYDTFTVPQLSGSEGYTYRVQSYIWNNLSTVAPMCAAGMLPY